MGVTTMRARPKRRPALDLDPQRIRRGQLGAGVLGVVAAMSADGLWIFRGDLKRWSGEYLPTGDQVSGKTLGAVRRQAAEPDVLERFTAAAAAVVADLGPLVAAGDLEALAALGAFEAPETTYRLAKRRLDILEGWLVASWEVDGVCACGGFLAGELHCDACPECLEQPPGLRIRCRQVEQHQACATVDALQCEHYRCTGRAAVAPCWTGSGACCGCCGERAGG